MAKKAKRQPVKSVANPTAASPAAPRLSTSVAGRASEKEFNPDYTYVIKDLKRIGTLAGIFFSILVILAFFLR